MNKLEKPQNYFTGHRSACNFRIDTGIQKLCREIAKTEQHLIADTVQALLYEGLEKYFETGFDDFSKYHCTYEYADHFIGLGINEKTANGLCRAGYKNISDLENMDLHDLLEIRNVGSLGAAQILNAVNHYLKEKDEAN